MDEIRLVKFGSYKLHAVFFAQVATFSLYCKFWERLEEIITQFFVFSSVLLKRRITFFVFIYAYSYISISVVMNQHKCNYDISFLSVTSVEGSLIIFLGISFIFGLFWQNKTKTTKMIREKMKRKRRLFSLFAFV